MVKGTNSTVLRYAVAVSSTALALLLTLLLWRLMEPNRLLLLLAAVILSSWRGGLGPGLLAAFLAVLSDLFFLDLSPSIGFFDNSLRLGLFMLMSLLIGLQSSRRKRAEDVLKQRAGFINQGHDAVISTDLDGYVTSWNRGAERAYGYTAEEALGKHVSIIYPAEDLDFLRRDVIAPLMEKGEHEVEVRARKKSGEDVYVQLSLSLLRDKEHATVGMIGYAVDITERRRAEEALRKAHDELETRVRERTAELSEANLLLQAETDERERAEKVLRESEQSYRLLFESNPHPMWVYDRETLSFLAVNEAAIRYYRYSREEFLAITIKDIRPPEDVPALLEKVSQVTPGINIAAGRHRKKDGTFIDVEIVSHTLTFAGRSAELVLAMDVTERKRAEEELKARARQQAAVAELGQRALSGTDLDALMDEAASLVTRMLGVKYCKILELLPEGDALLLRAGVGWKDGYVGRATVGAGLNSQAGYTLLSSEPVVVEDLSAETRFNGPPLLHEHEVVSGMSVIINDHHRPFGVLGAHTTKRRRFTRDDVNFLQAVANVLAEAIQRRQAEEEHVRFIHEQAARAEAEEARRRMAFLAEASNLLTASLDYRATLKSVARFAVPTLTDYCTVDILDEDGAIHRVEVACADPQKSELAHALQKYPPDFNNLEIPVTKVLHTGKLAFYPAVPDSLLVAGAWDAEHLRILRALGPKSHVVAPLVARGRTLGTISFTLAESDRHYGPADLALIEELAGRAALAVDNARLYEQAQGANRDKDEFLATVSHELRTPLTSMLIWIRMLASGKLDEETSTHALKTLAGNVKSLTQLINDLLDVSRVITGKLRIDARPVKLIPIIEAAIDTIRPAADAKKIEIKPALDPLVRPILGDPDRLQQVLWNLLSNAIKFSPVGGRVEVRLEEAVSDAQITVSDMGQGISPDFLPYVFDHFRQADSSDARAYGGLGLGLAIVRHLVEMHGGTVSAQSPGEGQGATFIVRLPFIAVRLNEDDLERMEPTVEEEVSFACPVSLEGLRVLVVDDKAPAREVVAVVLEHCGARVTQAASCAEALDVIGGDGSDRQPDVLVADIGMPGEDGYALIRKVRALDSHRGGKIPAVALTAHANIGDRVRALSAGFQAYISKPAEPTELVVVVASLTGRTGEL